MDGYIKIYRKLLEWEWYSDGNVLRLFLHLLLNANFRPSRFRGIDLPTGTLVTSIESLSAMLNLTNQQIRTAMKKLESTHEINRQITNKFTIITICKWESYQCENNAEQQANNKQITNKQQTNNKQITTEEEYKNVRKKECIIDCSCENSQPTDQPKKIQTLEERQKEFYDDVAQYVGKYEREMLRAFYDYWCEPNQKNTKMRKELERSWSTGGRLATWYRRQNESQNNNNQQLSNKNYGNNQQNYRKEGLSDAEILEAVAGGFALFNANKHSDNQ